jgi:hypothetical protein
MFDREMDSVDVCCLATASEPKVGLLLRGDIYESSKTNAVGGLNWLTDLPILNRQPNQLIRQVVTLVVTFWYVPEDCKETEGVFPSIKTLILLRGVAPREEHGASSPPKRSADFASTICGNFEAGCSSP